jgi:hypothetical protein
VRETSPFFIVQIHGSVIFVGDDTNDFLIFFNDNKTITPRKTEPRSGDLFVI